MQTATEKVIKKIHAAPGQLVYVCAGAGTDALSELFSVAGASRTILECVVPYSKISFEHLLGYEPDKFVSKKNALQLAGRALTRAQLLTETSTEPLIGVSCTAAIVTDRPKRGAHRAFIATWQAERIILYRLNLQKGARVRVAEEELVSAVVLNAIAGSVGCDEQVQQSLLPGDALDVSICDIDGEADKLYAGKSNFFAVDEFGRIANSPIQARALLAGSFNPLHAGHLGLAAAASKHLGKPIAFEISAFNVEKAPLEKRIALKRLTQFAGHHAIYLSNAPTFVEKARIYGKMTFVVGYDTARRIVHPWYYNDSEEEMLSRLRELLRIGSSFLVADRAEEDGVVRTVEGLVMAEEFRPMFSRLPDFRFDISSSDLRKVGSKGSR